MSEIWLGEYYKLFIQNCEYKSHDRGNPKKIHCTNLTVCDSHNMISILLCAG